MPRPKKSQDYEYLSAIVSVTLTSKELDEIDKERGDVPRAAFLRKIIIERKKKK